MQLAKRGIFDPGSDHSSDDDCGPQVRNPTPTQLTRENLNAEFVQKIPEDDFIQLLQKSLSWDTISLFHTQNPPPSRRLFEAIANVSSCTRLNTLDIRGLQNPSLSHAQVFDIFLKGKYAPRELHIDKNPWPSSQNKHLKSLILQLANEKKCFVCFKPDPGTIDEFDVNYGIPLCRPSADGTKYVFDDRFLNEK